MTLGLFYRSLSVDLPVEVRSRAAATDESRHNHNRNNNNRNNNNNICHNSGEGTSSLVLAPVGMPAALSQP